MIYEGRAEVGNFDEISAKITQKPRRPCASSLLAVQQYGLMNYCQHQNGLGLSAEILYIYIYIYLQGGIFITRAKDFDNLVGSVLKNAARWRTR